MLHFHCLCYANTSLSLFVLHKHITFTVYTGLSGAGDMPVLKGLGRVAQKGGGGDSSRPPDRILFVEDMTEIFSVTLPNLWRLGQAYLRGNIFQGVALLTENQKKLAQKCEINKSKFEVRRAGNHYWSEL